MDQTMSVQVMKGQVRKAPSFLSPVLTTLPYTETVRILSENGDWRQVKADRDGSTGWMHASALSEKKIVLTPGSENARESVSGEEYALAGKGFSKEVEKRYQSQNPHLNFSWIDRMETFTVSQKTITAFLKEGRLSPQGGEA